MRFTISFLVLLFVMPGFAIGEPNPEVPSLSADQVQRLQAGEVLVEVIRLNGMVGDVMGVIEAPKDQVLAVIMDYDAYTEFMPYMEAWDVTGQEGEFTICSGITDTPWPMDDRHFVVRTWSGPREIDGVQALVSTWDYVPDSGNIADTEGYWLLLPWGADGQHTLLRYYLLNDMGTWIPDFLMEWASGNLLPDTITAIRERVPAH